MEGMSIVQASGLRKEYPRVLALDDLTCEIPEGAVRGSCVVSPFSLFSQAWKFSGSTTSTTIGI